MADSPKKVNPWFAHVAKVRGMKKNKNLSYKEALVEAKKSYKPVTKKPAKKSKKVTGGAVPVEQLPTEPSNVELPSTLAPPSIGVVEREQITRRPRGRPPRVRPTPLASIPEEPTGGSVKKTRKKKAPKNQ